MVDLNQKSSIVRVRDASGTPAELKGGAVAIGNFDGVHRGHRAVLDEALRIANDSRIPALVLTFEPHPRTVFRPDNPVFRITPAAQKASLLGELGFAGVVEQHFDAEFSQMEASDFIGTLLASDLGARHVVTGEDFHFGHKRQGTPQFLRERGLKHNIDVTPVEARRDGDGEIISSGRIREALAQGDIELANSLLGRPWTVSGTVIQGAQLGRTLGYPTANLSLPAETELKFGVYAVRVTLANGDRHDGVASYGRRPTFDNGEALLESYLFDFSGNLYDQEISVEFQAYLRGEEKFDSPEALIEQMQRDEQAAKAVLAARTEA